MNETIMRETIVNQPVPALSLGATHLRMVWGWQNMGDTKAHKRWGASAKQPKWHLCAGDTHLWPEALKSNAVLCCRDMTHDGPAHAPLYVCTEGRHVWSDARNASLCCDGHVPVWRPMGPSDGGAGLRGWVLRLVPIADVTAMDEQSSCRDENPAHLYRPM